MIQVYRDLVIFCSFLKISKKKKREKNERVSVKVNRTAPHKNK